MSLLWKTAVEQEEPEAYYHGTIHPFSPGEHVLPSAQTGRRKNYAHESDPDHAYATTKESHAWDYAEQIWGGAPLHHPDFGGPPRVYQVRPLGPVEKDPDRNEQYDYSRGVNSTDLRSRHGFEVLHEVPMPEHMGDPDEWR